MPPRSTPRLVRLPGPGQGSEPRSSRDEVVHLEPAGAGRPSLEEAFRRHSAAVASVGFRILGSRAEAEDPASVKPVEDAVFTSTTIQFADPEPAACRPTLRGSSDFFSNPHASGDGTQCSIDRIVLRAKGVPASTQN